MDLIAQLELLVTDGLPAQAERAASLLAKLRSRPDDEAVHRAARALVAAALHDPELRR